MINQTLAGLPVEDVSPKTRRRDLAVIVVAGLLLFALDVDFLLYGDAALYGDYSLRRKFTEVTLHIGYYWLLIGANATFGNLFNVPMQELMVWVNVVGGAFILAMSYLLALEFLGRRRSALLTAFVMGFVGRLNYNATTSEMYVVQTSFVLLSFWLFTRDKTVFSALSAAAAMLVSPLSAFAFLFFPVYDRQKHQRIRWRELLMFAAIVIVAYLPYCVHYYEDLLWGRRGLLVIRSQSAIAPAQLLANFPKYQFKQYTALLVLVVPALIYARKHARLFAIAAAVAIPHLYIILKLTAEDNVFILNTDLFFVMILVAGWSEISTRKYLKWIGPAALSLHVIILIASGSIFTFTAHRGYAQEMKGIADKYIRNKDATMITDWGTAVSFVYFGRTVPATVLTDEPLFKQQVYDADDPQANNPALLNAKDLYLMDRWAPTPLNHLFRSKEAIQKQSEEYSTLSVAERRLKVKCTLINEATNRLYHCVRNVAAPPS